MRKATAYPAGGVLAPVTWRQRDDPDVPQSVEFVEVATGGRAGSYRRFPGPQSAEDDGAASVAEQRKRLMLDLSPAWLP